jgi:formate dehydrogenase subunit gamma
MNSTHHPEKIAALIATHQHHPGALLPMLHAIQEMAGFIPPESVAAIAAALSLSRAEVHGVITFYHFFRSAPPARHQIQICCAESCQSMGSEQLYKHAELTAGPECSVQPVYCLGLCANSPAMMIDDTLHARVTPAKFDNLINKIANKS